MNDPSYVTWRVYLSRDELIVWLWRRRGFKIKRKRDMLFSERYALGCKVFRLPAGWRFIWVTNE